MSGSPDELIRLLDGKIDAAELARNPTLASIADRVYGVKIDPNVKPKKARDLVEGETTVSSTQIENTSNPMDLMIEVVEGQAPGLEIPGPLPAPLPNAAIPNEPVLKTKKRSILFFPSLLGLGVVIANLFGAFSFLGGNCIDGDLCPADGFTRLNLLDFWKIDTGYAWSEPITNGVYGIPDLVAGVVLIILVLFTIRKK